MSTPHTPRARLSWRCPVCFGERAEHWHNAPAAYTAGCYTCGYTFRASFDAFDERLVEREDADQLRRDEARNALEQIADLLTADHDEGLAALFSYVRGL